MPSRIREILESSVGQYIDLDTVNVEVRDELPNADSPDAQGTIIDENTVVLRTDVAKGGYVDAAEVLSHEIAHIIQARNMGFENLRSMAAVERATLGDARYDSDVLQGVLSPGERINQMELPSLAEQNFLGGNYTLEQIARRTGTTVRQGLVL